MTGKVVSVGRASSTQLTTCTSRLVSDMHRHASSWESLFEKGQPASDVARAIAVQHI